MNEKKIGAILGFVYTGLQSVISILYIPLLLTGIGKSEYGIYQIAGSVIAYFSAMEAPLSASVLKFYVEYKVKNDRKNMENVLATGRRIFLVLSVFFCLVSIPVGYILKYSFVNTFTEGEIIETIGIFGLMLFNLIINMNNYVYIAVINANERFVFLKLSSIVTLIAQPILVVLIIQHYHYAFSIVAVQCLMNLIMVFLRYYFAKKKLNCSIKYHGYDKLLYKGMLVLTLANLGVALADQIFWKTDQLILGSFFGPEIVTEYSIGAQLNSMYISVACVLGGLILPTVTRILINGTNNDVSSYFIKIGKLQSYLLVLVLFGVISFGQEFIFLLAGNGYDMSYSVALILMIPYSIDLIQICGNSILQVRNQYGYRAKMMMVSSLLNVCLTIILIKIIGPIGAALSTAIAIVLGNGVYLNYIYYSKMNIDICEFFRNIRGIWFVGLLMLPIGYLIRYLTFSNYYLTFGVHVLIFMIIYSALLFLFVLSKNEKEIIIRKMK